MKLVVSAVRLSKGHGKEKVVVFVDSGASPGGREFLDKVRGTAYLSASIRAPVAQLDRASDFESAGRAFESPRARTENLAVSHPSGRVAQLAEHRTLNPLVEGSIPSALTSTRTT